VFLEDAMGNESNKKLDYAQSNHFVIGYENMFTSMLKLKVEAYYQLFR
jgi:outer membrane receptor for Fe3+-dicitrate